MPHAPPWQHPPPCVSRAYREALSDSNMKYKVQTLNSDQTGHLLIVLHILRIGGTESPIGFRVANTPYHASAALTVRYLSGYWLNHRSVSVSSISSLS